MGKAFFLIVDDDVLLAKAYMRMAGGYFLESGRKIETIVVNSGPEAIKSAMHHAGANPGSEWGLLTNYDMPDMTGSELIDRLDDLLGHRLVWRLLLTGELTPERKAELEAKQAFVDQKPVTKADLESYLYTFIMTLE